MSPLCLQQGKVVGEWLAPTGQLRAGPLVAGLSPCFTEGTPLPTHSMGHLTPLLMRWRAFASLS